MDMKINWIVVAHRSGARIFAKADDHHLHVIHQIENLDGRLKNQEINSDRPGRTFSPMGNHRHGLSQSLDSTEQVTVNFSKEVARFLEESRNQNRFDSLTLVAGPDFLGQLRKDLSDSTCACIGTTLGKNLGGFTERETRDYLEKELRQTFPLPSKNAS